MRQATPTSTSILIGPYRPKPRLHQAAGGQVVAALFITEVVPSATGTVFPLDREINRAAPLASLLDFDLTAGSVGSDPRDHQEPHASPLIPILICLMGVFLLSVMDAAVKGLVLAIGAYNALLWRSAFAAPCGGTHLDRHPQRRAPTPMHFGSMRCAASSSASSR